MELVNDAATAHEVIYCIMIVMGYAIAFSFLMIALAKREIRYMEKRNEQDLKYLKESLQGDIKWLKIDNDQLRKDLQNLSRKN